MLDKRTRSPNYPSMSLPEAIQRAELVYKNQHSYGAPRETVAKSMGYNGLNGASATAISALIKYGLLEGRAEDIKISERAMRILHPENPAEKARAIQDAANSPTLFQELKERFPERLPSEEVLRNHLIRTGFAPAAVSSVILAYRETIEFAERQGAGYDSVKVDTDQEPIMQAIGQPAATTSSSQRPISLMTQEDERTIVAYEFEDGGILRISISGEIDTADALDMAETQIAIKRKEIERRNARRGTAPQKNEKDEGENDADACA